MGELICYAALKLFVPESKQQIKGISCLLTALEGLYSSIEWELVVLGEVENTFTCIPEVLHFFFNE